MPHHLRGTKFVSYTLIIYILLTFRAFASLPRYCPVGNNAQLRKTSTISLINYRWKGEWKMAKRSLRMPTDYTDATIHQDNIPNAADTPSDSNDSTCPNYSAWRVFYKSFEYTFCGIMISYLAAYFLSQLLT